MKTWPRTRMHPRTGATTLRPSPAASMLPGTAETTGTYGCCHRPSRTTYLARPSRSRGNTSKSAPAIRRSRSVRNPSVVTTSPPARSTSALSGPSPTTTRRSRQTASLGLCEPPAQPPAVLDVDQRAYEQNDQSRLDDSKLMTNGGSFLGRRRTLDFGRGVPDHDGPIHRRLANGIRQHVGAAPCPRRRRSPGTQLEERALPRFRPRCGAADTLELTGRSRCGAR